MSDFTARILIFTPTYLREGAPTMRQECARSIGAAIEALHAVSVPAQWMIGTDNPWPAGDHRNVLHQYQSARAQFLAGDWSDFITFEHDHELPDPDALRRMLDTPGDVVYAPYMLRHGPPNLISTWCLTEDHRLGDSLTLHPVELAAARAAVVWPVGGMGFGCTLFRRRVLDAIPFMASDEQNQCPDLAFAQQSLAAGYQSVGRFDVPVRHRWLGSWWSPWGDRLTEPDNSDLVDGQWQIDHWLGKEQWRCAMCQWDTLRGLAVARAHAANCTRCNPIEVNEPSQIVVADKYGKEKTA